MSKKELSEEEQEKLQKKYKIMFFGFIVFDILFFIMIMILTIISKLS